MVRRGHRRPSDRTDFHKMRPPTDGEGSYGDHVSPCRRARLIRQTWQFQHPLFRADSKHNLDAIKARCRCTRSTDRRSARLLLHASRPRRPLRRQHRPLRQRARLLAIPSTRPSSPISTPRCRVSDRRTAVWPRTSWRSRRTTRRAGARVALLTRAVGHRRAAELSADRDCARPPSVQHDPVSRQPRAFQRSVPDASVALTPPSDQRTPCDRGRAGH